MKGLVLSLSHTHSSYPGNREVCLQLYQDSVWFCLVDYLWICIYSCNLCFFVRRGFQVRAIVNTLKLPPWDPKYTALWLYRCPITTSQINVQLIVLGGRTVTEEPVLTYHTPGNNHCDTIKKRSLEFWVWFLLPVNNSYRWFLTHHSTLTHTLWSTAATVPAALLTWLWTQAKSKGLS